MPSCSFSDIVETLTSDQPPRVWSLLITVFGDLAQEEGAQVSGAVLRGITQQLGIKPEAMRVAIYRLRKEGWIDSQRNGRTSSYFLTDWGRAQSAQATPRIYTAQQAAEQAWLHVHQTGQHTCGDGATITAHCVLCPTAPTNDDCFATRLEEKGPVPDWVRDKVGEAELTALSQDFASKLAAIQPGLNALQSLSVSETATLRVLLVHSWRRIVLKAPVLPDFVFSTGWRGPYCRQTVTDLLARYEKPPLPQLEAAMHTP